MAVKPGSGRGRDGRGRRPRQSLSWAPGRLRRAGDRPKPASRRRRQEFEERTRFGDQKPLIEIDETGHDIKSNLDPDQPAASTRPDVMVVMIWDPQDERIVRVRLPFWLCASAAAASGLDQLGSRDSRSRSSASDLRAGSRAPRPGAHRRSKSPGERVDLDAVASSTPLRGLQRRPAPAGAKCQLSLPKPGPEPWPGTRFTLSDGLPVGLTRPQYCLDPRRGGAGGHARRRAASRPDAGRRPARPPPHGRTLSSRAADTATANDLPLERGLADSTAGRDAPRSRPIRPQAQPPLPLRRRRVRR
jgi:hypothetical protein